MTLLREDNLLVSFIAIFFSIRAFIFILVSVVLFCVCFCVLRKEVGEDWVWLVDLIALVVILS